MVGLVLLSPPASHSCHSLFYHSRGLCSAGANSQEQCKACHPDAGVVTAEIFCCLSPSYTEQRLVVGISSLLVDGGEDCWQYIACCQSVLALHVL